MPQATLTIPSSVEHVRTARLVAVAAARRAGLDEATVDDVRLAVGEVVARAVLRHTAASSSAEVDMVVRDDGDGFEIEVCGDVAADAPDPDDDDYALALVRALAPELTWTPGCTVVRWPLAPR